VVLYFRIPHQTLLAVLLSPIHGKIPMMVMVIMMTMMITKVQGLHQTVTEAYFGTGGRKK
jgi:hypothetical protein